MTHIVFFLEEPSAQAMLEGFLPKIMPAGVYPRYIVFEGKQDLEKRLVHRMRGYLVPGARFIVLRDQDAANCKTVKKALLSGCFLMYVYKNLIINHL